MTRRSATNDIYSGRHWTGNATYQSSLAVRQLRGLGLFSL